jgi:hypothetical protein
MPEISEHITRKREGMRRIRSVIFFLLALFQYAMMLALMKLKLAK